jgi:hypothetical protein
MRYDRRTQSILKPGGRTDLAVRRPSPGTVRGYAATTSSIRDDPAEGGTARDGRPLEDRSGDSDVDTSG